MIFVPCKSYHTAKRRFPNAVGIARTEQGFFAFNSLELYRMWKYLMKSTYEVRHSEAFKRRYPSERLVTGKEFSAMPASPQTFRPHLNLLP